MLWPVRSTPCGRHPAANSASSTRPAPGPGDGTACRPGRDLIPIRFFNRSFVDFARPVLQHCLRLVVASRFESRWVGAPVNKPAAPPGQGVAPCASPIDRTGLVATFRAPSARAARYDFFADSGAKPPGFFREDDIDLQHLVAILLSVGDPDVVGVHLDVFGDDGDQFALQVGREVGVAAAVALVGDDDGLQALLGDLGGFGLLPKSMKSSDISLARTGALGMPGLT